MQPFISNANDYESMRLTTWHLLDIQRQQITRMLSFRVNVILQENLLFIMNFHSWLIAIYDKNVYL